MMPTLAPGLTCRGSIQSSWSNEAKEECSLLIEFLTWLEAQPKSWLYSILGLVAFTEYLIPPIPGDVIVLFGMSLAIHAGAQLLPALASVVTGSMAGVLITYAVGRYCVSHPWIVQRFGQSRFATSPTWTITLQSALSLIREKGLWLLILNRFLPAVRALIFLAAGLARVSLTRVFFGGLAASVLWNSLLATGAYFLGANFGRLIALLDAYQKWAIAIGLLISAIVTARWFWVIRHRHAAKHDNT